MPVRSIARWCAIISATLLTLAALSGLARQPADAPAPAPSSPARFAAVHVLIDTAGAALGAYQIDLRAVEGDIKIVGIEGATESPAAAVSGFAKPPYYDPRAMMSERVIIGALSTDGGAAPDAEGLRIATIHIRIAGNAQPRFETRLTVAADAEGNPIDAKVTTELVQGGGS